MIEPTLIYHNPNCSKSRQTLALLEERDLELKVIEYLKQGIDAETLNRIIDLLGGDPAQVLRKKGEAYEASGLDASSSRDEIVRVIANTPSLLERPIVVHRGRAAMGRPPENILSILD